MHQKEQLELCTLKQPGKVVKFLVHNSSVTSISAKILEKFHDRGSPFRTKGETKEFFDAELKLKMMFGSLTTQTFTLRMIHSHDHKENKTHVITRHCRISLYIESSRSSRIIQYPLSQTNIQTKQTKQLNQLFLDKDFYFLK